ncbi:cyclopropane-fatty-acyl-phospholipid synthase family protein [Streptomyces sp. 549]|uniref:cyclopropane-fatty-acyl-phospholipid synthase family protein n=1 Tax=Streptomyces sp. 549 TaxID=3049076 RepID=UPI0024C25DA4|nr:cyclopropane-fatty-acyl-phospholipid synthase family protein [Streptomyces sp. 549]MDK1475792.1 cyclopropane-fatty-acyl-phospholipid synthase family protein [Streptomyces sp. 549]
MTAADRVRALAETALGSALPLRVRAWDGSEAGPPEGPVLVIRHRRALRRLLWRPGELGAARAWVAGDLDVEGDLYEALERATGLLWLVPEEHAPRGSRLAATAREMLALAGPMPPPPPPPEEVRGHFGARHSKLRDRRTIRHHYDVGNDFYRCVLGPSMVYSCAYWTDGGTLEQAQHDKLDLVCRKLALQPGDRLLDVGCGWGSLLLHAAGTYGVRATGVTLSREQAAMARKRVAEAGLADKVEIRVQDYRDVDDGPYDAIASLGMAEHVGSDQYRLYADQLHALLRPGGRLLNHQIARRPHARERAYRLNGFIDRYVFPDGELSPVGHTVSMLEQAGFEVRDLESLREHYALTLRAWVGNLEAALARPAAPGAPGAVRLTNPGRARVWRLYMAASALSFERNRIGVNQVLAVRTPSSGSSGLPLRTRDWRS